MNAVFLSASVPVLGRGDYYESANPFLIQCAVRELVIATIQQRKLVWGGHPAITPMIWAICESLNVDYAQSVVLYQSKYFDDRFPEEAERFKNVVYVDEVPGDENASLHQMRMDMLSRPDFDVGVFIGGMEGVEAEYEMFTQLHPKANVISVASTGGASLFLARRIGQASEPFEIDFATLFNAKLQLNS